MRPDRDDALAWEARWSRPAGIAALAAVVLFVAAIVIATQVVGGNDGSSELLRDADAHPGATMLANFMQAIGVGLLAAPLYFLFRAGLARSETMRRQLVGVAIAGPLFLAVAAILISFATVSAAEVFVSDEVPRLMADGVELSSDRANEVADDTVADAGLAPVAGGFELGGRIAFVVAMFYAALHAMRTGLLTRFWGSLGMALGIVSFLPPFRPFVLLWFIYLGLLLADLLPGPKPPAWKTGEAMPWPTPGEKAAGRMGSGDDDESGEEEATEVGEPERLGSGERRKRKQRD